MFFFLVYIFVVFKIVYVIKNFQIIKSSLLLVIAKLSTRTIFISITYKLKKTLKYLRNNLHKLLKLYTAIFYS